MRVAALLAAAVLAAGTPAHGAVPTATCDGRTATIVGTDGDDVLRGTDGPDVVAALGGDDEVSALGGDDVVCGGEGADVLDGGPGDDRLLGQLDRVDIESRAGLERFGDTLRGGPGDDVLEGGVDPRPVEQPDGADVLDYSTAPRGVHVDLAARRATGDGRDTIVGTRQLEVHGSPYADTLLGSAHRDVMFGERGPDVLVGRGGDDRLDGEGSSRPPPDRDELWGGRGRDTLLSSKGQDVLHGGPGDDVLGSNSAAASRLYGGPGDDDVQQVVPRGSGWVSDGGPGHNRLSLTTSFTASHPGVTVTVDLRGGKSEVNLTPSSVGSVSGYSVFFLEGELGWAVVGTDGAEVVDASLTSSLRFTGHGGDDVVRGPPAASGRVLVNGGPGNDKMLGAGSCENVERGSCR